MKTTQKAKFYAVLIVAAAILGGIGRIGHKTTYVSAPSMDDARTIATFASVSIDSEPSLNAVAPTSPGKDGVPTDASPSCGRKCLGMAAFDAESAFLVARGETNRTVSRDIRTARTYYLSKLEAR